MHQLLIIDIKFRQVNDLRGNNIRKKLQTLSSLVLITEEDELEDELEDEGS